MQSGMASHSGLTYSVITGMPELSTGVREQLNSYVEELTYSPRPSPSSPPEPIAVAMPLYIYPENGAWDALYAAMEKYPGTIFHVIVNPANGPGRRVPDTNYIKEVARLNTFKNCKIFGYVHVSWAKRKINLVKGDITTWSHWADYKMADLHVEGIFIDEAPSDLTTLGYMREVYDHAKECLGSKSIVWTNPGNEIDEQFYDVADFVNSHENSHEAWRSRSGNTKAKSTAMVHSYSGSLEEMQDDLDKLKTAGYRSVLITTGNAYTGFSPFFDLFVSSITQLNAPQQW